MSFSQSDIFSDTLSFAKANVGDDSLQEVHVKSPVVITPSSQGCTFREDACLQDSLYWSKIQPYYVKYDSLRVNPYDIDPVLLKDTIEFNLCATEIGDCSYCMPIDSNHISSQFGARRYRWHYGIDIRLDVGDTVRAAFDGIVRIEKYNYRGYGKYVVVRHYNGLETLYGHLSSQLVKVGQVVKAGDVLGLGGNTGRSTGPHLHFEIRYQGNAINPERVFDFENHCMKECVLCLMPSDYDYVRELRKKKYHTIRSGDCLSKLAVKYHTSINKICRLNGISRSYILQIGKKLRVR